jgi:hypothetical protein
MRLLLLEGHFAVYFWRLCARAEELRYFQFYVSVVSKTGNEYRLDTSLLRVPLAFWSTSLFQGRRQSGQEVGLASILRVSCFAFTLVRLHIFLLPQVCCLGAQRANYYEAHLPPWPRRRERAQPER